MKRAFLPIAMLLAGALAFSEPSAPKGMEVPPPDAAGKWEGTWFYVDPGFEIAIFVTRDKAGLLKMRYHVQSKSGTNYETNEAGLAKYIDDAGSLVEVVFTATESGPNRITGHYERKVRMKNRASRESSEFEMYRTEKGRKIVLHYPVYTVEVKDGSGHTNTSSETDKYRFFRKASEIVIDFDEIPF